MSVTQQQVVSLLENVLFESASQAAANATTWAANAAATDVSTLAAAMAGSGEEKIAATVVGYYLTSLGRAPSAAEIHFYVGLAEEGLSQSQIAAGQVSDATWNTIAGYFSHSTEFASRAGLDYSLGATGAMLEAVPFLYESVLGRIPSGAEISYYDNQVVSGADIGVLFREFTASPEFHTDTDSQIAQALAAYGSAAASGQPVSATIGATVELDTPAPPPPPPVQVPSYAFTTGTDIFNTSGSGHDYTATLGGAAPTLTAGDTLTGPSNTLTITDTSGAASRDILPPIDLQGISSMTLTTTGNAGSDVAHPFDVSSAQYIDLYTLTINSSGTHGDFVAVYIDTAVTINQAGASPIVSVSGTYLTLDIHSGSLTTLDLSNTIAVNAGTVTLTDPAGPTSLTVNLDAEAMGGITDASNHITDLTLAGSANASSIGAATASSIVDSALTHLTVTGDVALGFPLNPVQLPDSLVAFTATGDTASALYVSYSGSGAILALGAGDNYLLDDGGNTVTAGDGANTILTGGTGTGETITLGNGGNQVIAGDGGGDSITVGGGANIITLQAASTGDIVHAGNGGNIVTDKAASGTAAIILGNGNNSFTDSGAGADHVTFGTGQNTADLGGQTSDMITVGVDATYGTAPTTPDLVVEHAAAGDTIALSQISGHFQTQYLVGALGTHASAAGTIANLESLLAGNGSANSFSLDRFGGDTFIVVTASGSLSATDTTVIQIVGYAGNVTWSGSDNILHLT